MITTSKIHDKDRVGFTLIRFMNVLRNNTDEKACFLNIKLTFQNNKPYRKINSCTSFSDPTNIYK